MTQLQYDALQLRCEQLEMRAESIERHHSFLGLVVFALAGLVVAFVIVGAVEIRSMHNTMEAQQWRSR